MKRHKALQGLSSEHHHGLVWARRLGIAEEKNEADNLSTLAAEFLKFWEADLQLHFRKEEELLFPYYFNCHGSASENVMETLRQHVEIRAAVLNLQNELTAGKVRAEPLLRISGLLNAHVRFEERELFEEIQGNCEDDALGQLLEVPELRK